MINQKSKIRNKLQELKSLGLRSLEGKFRDFKAFKLQSLEAPKLRGGFTLIEIMVAVSIFSIVMLISISSVLAIVSANRKAQALNSVINNLNFALEGMVRDLRTGFDYDCAGDGTDCTDGETSVSFYSSQYAGGVTYSFDQENLAITKTIPGGEAINLTGQEVDIESLVFYVTGTEKTPEDYYQPKIIITIKGQFQGFGAPTQFNLQTMVTQRKLDI